MNPDSKVLTRLNEDFLLPSSPLYRAYYGLDGNHASVIHPWRDGDCVVTASSALGNGMFDLTGFEVEFASHTNSFGLFFCTETPITSHTDVIARIEDVMRAPVVAAVRGKAVQHRLAGQRTTNCLTPPICQTS